MISPLPRVLIPAGPGQFSIIAGLFQMIVVVMDTTMKKRVVAVAGEEEHGHDRHDE